MSIFHIIINKKGSSNTHCASLQLSSTTLKIFNVRIVKQDCYNIINIFQNTKRQLLNRMWINCYFNVFFYQIFCIYLVIIHF